VFLRSKIQTVYLNLHADIILAFFHVKRSNRSRERFFAPKNFKPQVVPSRTPNGVISVEKMEMFKRRLLQLS
jgi:hypothetical protein